jgi:hypothetical protein
MTYTPLPGAESFLRPTSKSVYVYVSMTSKREF